MSESTPSGLPLVVQVGFAGARKLFDAKAHPGIDPVAFEKSVQEQFQKILADELAPIVQQYFLCGISPVAIGGDTIFTRTCDALGMLQRVFLPQPRDEFLNAAGSSEPDFTDAEKAVAKQLLDGKHVVQERVVSDSTDRHERFHDVNLEIVRVSDIVVCLLPEQHVSKPGGSQEFIDLAIKRKRPVLEIRIAAQSGAPVLTKKWNHRENFKPPTVPDVVAKATLPKNALCDPLPRIDDYTRGLKDLTSTEANKAGSLFRSAAIIIIGAHVFATVMAVLALKLHSYILLLLLIEMVLLFLGFLLHEYLHATHRVERWAIARLAAEIARSVSSIGQLHLYPEYLFTLPVPPSLRPLLRTLNVLHLRSTISHKSDPWTPNGEAKRDQYIHNRLTSKEKPKAQIEYNTETRDDAGRKLTIARRTFLAASSLAFFATLFKFLIVCECVSLNETTHDLAKAAFGFCAIVLPVVAVAALSLAAAFDWEARYAVSDEVIEFLNEQKTLLQNASSTREYSKLLIETESRLLGETVNWYARRSFLGVA